MPTRLYLSSAGAERLSLVQLLGIFLAASKAIVLNSVFNTQRHHARSGLPTALALMALWAAVALLFTASVSPAKADTPNDTTKQIVETPLADAPAADKRALVVGVDGYENVPKLTECVADAHHFADFLRDKMGFTNVTVMTDEPGTPEMLQPTYTHFIRQFGLLLQGAVPNHTQIVIFYSGHGIRTQDSQNGDSDWLVPIDADPANISTTCFNYSRFKSMLDTMRPARALLVMDACRNILRGKAAVGESGFGGARVPLGPEIAELLSCQPDQTSQEGDPADFSESVFTHFFLAGLAGDPNAVDPTVHAITFDSLKIYVQAEVSDYVQTRLNSAQLPDGDATFGGMVLARSNSDSTDQSVTVETHKTTAEQQAANARLTALWLDPQGTFSENRAASMTIVAVKAALSAGADVNAQDYRKQTALLLAAQYGLLDLVKFLVKQGANIEAVDYTGHTPLIAAAVKGRVEVVRYIVLSGANIEDRSVSSYTALMDASEGCHAQVVRLLLVAGAQPNAADKDGRTALWYAEHPAPGVSNSEKADTIAALKEDGATN